MDLAVEKLVIFFLVVGVALLIYFLVTRNNNQDPENMEGDPAPDNVDVSHRMLVAFDYAMEKTGSQYWASCGTMLGVERHGGFIPWDYDVDVQVWPETLLEKKGQLNSILMPLGYEVIEEDKINSSTGLMARVVHKGDGWGGKHLDIFTLDPKTGRAYSSTDDDRDLMCLHVGAENVGTPVKRQFGNMQIYAMENGPGACEKMYGKNWKKQIAKHFGQEKGQKLKGKIRPPALPSDDFMDKEPQVLKDHYENVMKLKKTQE